VRVDVTDELADAVPLKSRSTLNAVAGFPVESTSAVEALPFEVAE
jgi:hypothetical protein